MVVFLCKCVVKHIFACEWWKGYFLIKRFNIGVVFMNNDRDITR